MKYPQENYNENASILKFQPNTVLFFSERFDVVKTFAENGVDLNAKCTSTKTALHVALDIGMFWGIFPFPYSIDRNSKRSRLHKQ